MLSVDPAKTVKTSRSAVIYINTSESIDVTNFILKQKNCSLLNDNADCNEVYTTHTNWSSSDVDGAIKLDIEGLLPYTMYNFMFNEVKFSVSTDAAAPEGFGEDKIHVTSTLTTLTVNWEKPAMLNGPLDQVTISITAVSSPQSNLRKRRSTGDHMLSSPEVSGSVLFNNLDISTVYTVQVAVINRYDVIPMT